MNRACVMLHCQNRRADNRELCAYHQSVVDSVATNEQALADVRTLDEWAAASYMRSWRLSHDPHDYRVTFYSAAGRIEGQVCGPTPDAARAAAAAWVR